VINLASKSFDYARDITILAMEKYGRVTIGESTAHEVSDFFEVVYKRLKEIEDKEKVKNH